MSQARAHDVTQGLTPDALIELYQLDTTALTALNGVPGLGTVYHWTPGVIGANPVTLAGVQYAPMQIEGTGWDWNGQGKLPQPSLRITNIGGLAAALVIEFGNLLGAEVTRTLIFKRFLDGQSEADPTAAFFPERYTINRKSAHTKSAIEFELRAQFDAQGVMLPRRQVIRNSCSLLYRAWNPVTSSYVPGTCPWVGGQYYKADGSVTYDPAADSCGKKLSDCLLRFKNTSASPALPFAGFPGVGITPQ